MKKIAIITILFALMMSCGNEKKADTQTASDTKVQTFDTHGQAGVDDGVSAKNILQIAIGSEAHTTLVAAVVAASLENVLANAGPLTVFAPTNEAFAKLPAGVVEDLLKPENKSKLQNIIHFHASPGSYTGKGLKDGMKLYQASGDYIKVTRDGDDIYVHGTKILATIKASNGVVHVVGDVLLPE